MARTDRHITRSRKTIAPKRTRRAKPAPHATAEKRSYILDVIDQTARAAALVNQGPNEPGLHDDPAADLLDSFLNTAPSFSEAVSRGVLEFLARNLDAEALDAMLEYMRDHEQVWIECYPREWRQDPKETGLQRAFREMLTKIHDEEWQAARSRVAAEDHVAHRGDS